jgi:hypothetical protein
MNPIVKTRLQNRPSLIEPSLPEDFAQRVIAQARHEQHRGRVRRRIAAGGGAGLLALLLMFSAYSRYFRTGLRPTPNSEVTADDSLDQSNLSAETDQLAIATAPADLDDYLMPNAAAFRNFDSAYTGDALWQDDDSAWPDNNG